MDDPEGCEGFGSGSGKSQDLTQMALRLLLPCRIVITTGIRLCHASEKTNLQEADLLFGI
jgi:hypothetical protein